MKNLAQGCMLACLVSAVNPVAAQQAPPSFVSYALPIPLAASMVYHPLRQVTLVFDSESSRVWEWDGQRFHPLYGATRAGSPTVWDGRNRRFVALNGVTWDGVQFGQMPMPQGVIGFDFLSYDVLRERLVAIRGTLVMEWDGGQWLRIQPPAIPGNLRGLVYSPEHGCCVLAAGQPLVLFGWQGDEWSVLDQGFPGSGQMSLVSLSHDPLHQRLLLLSWVGFSPQVRETWSFTAGNWQQLPTPAAVAGTARQLVFDGHGMLCQGMHGEFWRLEGHSWHQLAFDPPAIREQASCASSQSFAAALVFGGLASGSLLDDTWLFAGEWLRVGSSPTPPARRRGLLAWSPTNQGYLLHGGIGLAGHLDDTWLFDGSRWRQQQPATLPTQLVTMATDPAGGVLALSVGLPQERELWRWSGTDWVVVDTYDFGWAYITGSAYFPPRNSWVAVGDAGLWEWDGIAWTASNLPSSISRSVFYRPDRQSLLMTDLGSSARFYEWDGSQVLQWPQGNSIVIAMGAPDYIGNRLSCFGGINLQSTALGLAAYYVTQQPATAVRSGYGCGLAAVPGLVTQGAPRPGTMDFAIAAETFVANAPCLWTMGFGTQPLHLGGGCVSWLENAPVVQFSLADQAGHARYPLPLPSGPQWHGVSLLAQAFALAPTASPIGSVVASDLLRITLGD